MIDATAQLADLLRRNRAGARIGVYSVCSAHPVVIAAALELARDRDQVAVIEATCNQVNQDGGYTDMRPADFAALVHRSAMKVGFPRQRLILGGDHLGPQPWRQLSAEAAMAKAERMVDAYVRAGFSKIHLDCSMRCADDPAILAEVTIAQRAARLAASAELAAADIGSTPLYIIGTEVPAPGGMGAGHAILPTPTDGVVQTWQIHAQAFLRLGLGDAFARVAAIVVQPGLDFGNAEVVPFVPAQARGLSARLADLPGAVYEAHSTDYQQPAAYAALIDGHFAILKVGPAATFALREALYALEAIEAELPSSAERSGLRNTLEQVMLASPKDWASHYASSPAEQAYLRHFSFSDRLRYYWTAPSVQKAVTRLLTNLGTEPLPLPLISQFLPHHVAAAQAATLAGTAEALCLANVKRALVPYADACGQHLAA